MYRTAMLTPNTYNHVLGYKAVLSVYTFIWKQYILHKYGSNTLPWTL